MRFRLVQPSSLTIKLEAELNGFDAKIGHVHVARGDLRLQAEHRPHYVHQLG